MRRSIGGKQLLGDTITDMATGLLVGGGTEKTPSGAFYASGCVPHACGSDDGFMAVDPQACDSISRSSGDNGEPNERGRT